MSIWASFYEHADYGGRSAFANLRYQDPPVTYLALSQSWLKNAKLHDRISSLEVGADSSESGGLVILFEHDRYSGRYSIFPCTPGKSVGTPWIGRNFNDITSSILIVRRHLWEQEPVAIGNLMVGEIPLRSEIANIIDATEGLSLRGLPIITWDMWPSFSPSRKYIYIRIPVIVDVPDWFDYDAEIRLWIYLYINSSGKVRGYVDAYGAWVEGGWKTQSVLDGLMEGIAARVQEFNDLISTALSGDLQELNFVRLYYLPGRADNTGHVEDDVTLVLVKML